jgi:hypothetical protein
VYLYLFLASPFHEQFSLIDRHFSRHVGFTCENQHITTSAAWTSHVLSAVRFVGWRRKLGGHLSSICTSQRAAKTELRNDRQSIDYQKNIRQYNMTVAFTSLGVTEDRSANRRGRWVFRISGELCHMAGSLSTYASK